MNDEHQLGQIYMHTHKFTLFTHAYAFTSFYNSAMGLDCYCYSDFKIEGVKLSMGIMSKVALDVGTPDIYSCTWLLSSQCHKQQLSEVSHSFGSLFIICFFWIY